MGWRVVCIANPARLSVKNASLVVKTGEEEPVCVPLEDISVLMVETRQASLSSHLLAELGGRGTLVFFCDGKHLPCASLLPFCQHSRALAALNAQLQGSEPFRKNCWRLVVRRKIENQAKCLELLGDESARELFAIASEVKSGDSTNRESVAARLYFLRTLPQGTRSSDNVPNAALDYGYAILRGAIARNIASHGFLPSLGVHHKSELNAFNLADDFIEPFRPLVDLWVAQNVNDAQELLAEHRIGLIELLSCLMLVEGEKVTVLRAIEVLAASFVTACREKRPEALKLPELIPIEKRREE